MERKFAKFTSKKRILSMLSVDFRRMFTMPLLYITLGICLVVPILIFVMTSMMEGSPTTDQYGNIILDEFGNPVLMEGFKNLWQMLGATSNAGMSMSMDLVSMCNINMMFMGITVIVSIFIAQDFRSGYAKHLFTVRSSKVDYVVSKTLVLFICAQLMVIAFVIGMLLGGAIAGISFEMVDVDITNIIMCVLTKMAVTLIFVSIFVLMSVIGKSRTWLSLVGGLAVSMLLFMMIPIISPLDSNIGNVLIALIGGMLFAIGLGAVSNQILKKTSLV